MTASSIRSSDITTARTAAITSRFGFRVLASHASTSAELIWSPVHDLILDIIDDDADSDGTVRLQHVVDTIQHRLGDSDLFPNGRLTNYVRYAKTDMEARCEIERIPASIPQRITRWRDIG